VRGGLDSLEHLAEMLSKVRSPRDRPSVGVPHSTLRSGTPGLRDPEALRRDTGRRRPRDRRRAGPDMAKVVVDGLNEHYVIKPKACMKHGEANLTNE
jgi:hypothetical protein